MGKFCDLHTHSVFSDGTCTPGEILREASQLGLSAVALCDHNTVDGLPSFLAAAKETDVTAICGTEFSVDFQGKELHLLGLFIPEAAFGQVSDLMRAVIEAKEKSNIALVESLNRAGYVLDYETIKAQFPDAKISRVHIGAELTRLGYTASVSDAFRSLLAKGGGHYVEPRRLGFFEMIDFIRSIHAVPVLAHPLLNLSTQELAQVLPAARRRGLAGMECLYSTYSEKETNVSRFLAAQNGLIPSGGSDFHGTNKPDIHLGTGKGNLRVPAQWVDALQRAAR